MVHLRPMDQLRRLSLPLCQHVQRASCPCVQMSFQRCSDHVTISRPPHGHKVNKVMADFSAPIVLSLSRFNIEIPNRFMFSMALGVNETCFFECRLGGAIGTVAKLGLPARALLRCCTKLLVSTQATSFPLSGIVPRWRLRRAGQLDRREGRHLGESLGKPHL